MKAFLSDGIGDRVSACWKPFHYVKFGPALKRCFMRAGAITQKGFGDSGVVA
jgi:hypothetical protein